MKSILWLLGSSACGVLVALAAFVMAARGHGWAATFVSATAILTGPAGAMTWLFRFRRAAIVVFAIDVVIDIVFVVLAVREGFASAASTLEHLWPLVIVWAALWIGLQVPPARAALTRESRSRFPRDP